MRECRNGCPAHSPACRTVQKGNFQENPLLNSCGGWHIVGPPNGTALLRCSEKPVQGERLERPSDRGS